MTHIIPGRVTVSKLYTNKQGQNRGLLEISTQDQKFTMFLDDLTAIWKFQFDDPVELEIRVRSENKNSNSQKL